jgi:hypothetical protein
MAYTDEQKQRIINEFLNWCEKIGYSDPEHPVQIDIVHGLPIGAKRAVQSVRFDIDPLTKSKQNTTMI